MPKTRVKIYPPERHDFHGVSHWRWHVHFHCGKVRGGDLYFDEYGYISDFYVCMEARGAGIYALRVAIERIIRQHNIPHLRANSASKKFYQRMGFVFPFDIMPMIGYYLPAVMQRRAQEEIYYGQNS